MDGDRVKFKPEGQYGGISDGLGEGQPFPRLANRLARLIARDVRKYGDEPVQLLIMTSHLVKEAVANPEGVFDPVAASYELDGCACQIWGHREGVNLSLEAGKECVIKSAGLDHSEDILYDVSCRYLWRIYDAKFAEAIALDAIHTTYDPNVIAARTAELRPYMEQHVHDMAKQISERESVKNLKGPRRETDSKSVMDSLEDDDLLKQE